MPQNGSATSSKPDTSRPETLTIGPFGDVQPVDLFGYDQAHFFAGIGVWSAALRQAGWSDDRPVWTGSCPCQPFSAAGKRQGEADDRHLWPELYRLIAACRPLVVFGEQVASKDGLAWLDTVQSDLEAAGYASGAVDLCAAGVGAPHIRQRLFWMAYAGSGGLWRGREHRDYVGAASEIREKAREQRFRAYGCSDCATRVVANPDGRNASAEGIQRGGEHGQQPQDCGAVWLGNASGAGFPQRERDRRVQREALGPQPGEAAECGGHAGRVAHSHEGQCGRLSDGEGRQPDRTPAGRVQGDGQPQSGGQVNGFWSDCDWIACTDGKARPVESGTFPLAHVDPNRVGRLRAYGNAINQEVAAEFIAAAAEEIKARLTEH